MAKLEIRNLSYEYTDGGGITDVDISMSAGDIIGDRQEWCWQEYTCKMYSYNFESFNIDLRMVQEGLFIF